MKYWFDVALGVFVILSGLLSMLVQWRGDPPPFGATGWLIMLLGVLLLRVAVLEDDRR